jgi:hypothetical protein
LPGIVGKVHRNHAPGDHHVLEVVWRELEHLQIVVLLQCREAPGQLITLQASSMRAHDRQRYREWLQSWATSWHNNKFMTEQCEESKNSLELRSRFSQMCLWCQQHKP